MKRSNQSGSITFDKSRAGNKYRARISVGVDTVGRTLRKTIGYFATRAEAQRALNKFADENGLIEYNATTTFGEMWTAYELQYLKKHNGRKISVWPKLKTACAAIWRKPIKEIKTTHLQVIIDKLGGAPRTQALRKVVLTSIYNMALRDDIVKKNYASYIEVDPIEKSEAHTSLDGLELQTLWQNTEDDYVRFMLIYIYTGMRVSEFINMEIANININERYMVGGCKTRAGRDRIIPIAKCIYPFFRDFYNKIRFQKGIVRDAFVSETHMRKQIIETCKNLGLKRHTSHDLRHTFITMCANNGVDSFTIKKIVGHTQTGITDKVYVHKTVEQLIQAVDSLPYGENMQLYAGECITSEIESETKMRPI